MAQHIAAEESGAYPPLGIISLATSVAERGRHEVGVIDCISEGLDYRQLEDIIRTENPDVVGLTLVTE